MPFLASQSVSSRSRSSSTSRSRSRREKDSIILRGAEIIRQQIKRQDELDFAYYSKLDPELEPETPLNKTSSFSSDEFMDYSLSPSSPKSTKHKPKNMGHLLSKAKKRSDPPAPKGLRAPSLIYQSQSSEISFPASTDDDTSLFTDGGERPPPPPPASELDSSFSFLDDSEWAEMQTSSMDDLGVFSPAWSMPAKHVSDDDVEDSEDELLGHKIDDYEDELNAESDERGMDTDDATFDDDGWKMDATPTPMHTAAPVAKKAIAKERFNIPSPLSPEYSRLLKDPGFRHAINAGQCWQSIVGQLVRFPSAWFSGARGPPLGVPSTKAEQPKWHFYGRFRVWNNPNLKKVVPNRASPGALLLHLIVQDLMTFRPVQDVVIGVFHPNARGIRRTREPDAQDEQNRDVWMAVRKREECVSVVDHVLSIGKLDGAKTPLGIHHITNHNMRAVFGDHPPMDTMFLAEDILYARLSRALESSPDWSPAEALLDMFAFEE